MFFFKKNQVSPTGTETPCSLTQRISKKIKMVRKGATFMIVLIGLGVYLCVAVGIELVYIPLNFISCNTLDAWILTQDRYISIHVFGKKRDYIVEEIERRLRK